MPEEILDVVNENDEVVGTVVRGSTYDPSVILRIVHIFVENSKGEILVQKRGLTLSYKPGSWMTSAGGHVRSGETYEQAGHREMREELGVDAPLTLISKDPFKLHQAIIIGTLKTKHEGPFTPEPREVEWVKFMTLAEIQAMIDRGDDFHPQFLFLLIKHYGLRGKA